jgi:hypothetical protein
MLVISNGAMKSGSTWLTGILLQMVDHQPLPPGYHDERFGDVPTIKRARIRQFLDEVDYHRVNYVSKNHFYYERRLFSRYRDVYVLDVQRDMADTLVSVFFHVKKKMSEANMRDPELDDIREAYRRHGATTVKDLVRYHAVWSRPCSWVYVSSYERLKENPQREIAAIGTFLGLTLSAEKIAAIIRDTSFEVMASTPRPADSGMEARFRKGVVGDHKNYFDDEILRDIRRLEAEHARYPRTLAEKIDFAWKCYRNAGRIGQLTGR